jgi:Family of unknown function (DUF6069)
MAILMAIVTNVIILLGGRLLTGAYPTAMVGTSEQIIGFGQVMIVTALVGLSAWGLLGVLERATPRARAIWTVIAVIVLVFSLLGPLWSGVNAWSKVVLACMHIGAAAVIIPLMRRSVAVRR